MRQALALVGVGVSSKSGTVCLHVSSLREGDEPLRAPEHAEHAVDVGICRRAGRVFAVAAPRVAVGGDSHALERIVVDVSHRREQLSFVADGDTSEASLEHVARVTECAVEVRSVGRRYAMDRFAHAAVRIVDDEVHVVAHEAPRDERDAAVHKRGPGGFHECRPVLTGFKQELFSVSPQGHVVVAGFRSLPWRSWHRSSCSPSRVAMRPEPVQLWTGFSH